MWEIEGDHYRVFYQGKWLTVEPSALLTIPNRLGVARADGVPGVPEAVDEGALEDEEPVLLRLVANRQERGPLTRREHEVLQCLAEGRTSQEIASELFISLKTVKNHLGSIYSKLDAHNRTQAVLSGMRLGLVRIAS